MSSTRRNGLNAVDILKLAGEIDSQDKDVKKLVRDAVMTDNPAELKRIWNQLVTIKEQETDSELVYEPYEKSLIKQVSVEDIELSATANQLLKNIVKHPFRPLTERYSLFSNEVKGNQVKKELLEEKLVIERRIRAKPVQRTLLQLTKKGRKYASERLDLDPQRKGRGGTIHRFWQHYIKSMFEEAGWEARIEEKDADVLVQMNELRVAVEVAMKDRPREISHVAKNLDLFDLVWIACRNDEIQAGIRQRLNENHLMTDSLTLKLFREFSDIDELRPADLQGFHVSENKGTE